MESELVSKMNSHWNKRKSSAMMLRKMKTLKFNQCLNRISFAATVCVSDCVFTTKSVRQEKLNLLLILVSKYISK